MRAGDHPRFPRRELARIPPPPSPLFEEVSPGGQHAAPAADLVGRCGQGLLPCRRRGLRGGLLRGPQVGGGPVFQRSCSGTEPPSLSLSATNFFILYEHREHFIHFATVCCISGNGLCVCVCWGILKAGPFIVLCLGGERGRLHLLQYAIIVSYVFGGDYSQRYLMK